MRLKLLKPFKQFKQFKPIKRLPKMAYTGGKLNQLNGKYGISAPHKSVPVMKLIKAHRPKSREELCQLIAFHHKNECPCGIKSQGTVEDFGRSLYDAQFREWGEYPYSLQECVQWEYDLFVVQSLRGTAVEDAALAFFQKNMACAGYAVTKAEGYVDEELRVDLIVSQNGETCCGIQVKPLTFNKMRDGVISFNKAANARWGKPVFYLFYNDDGQFTNTEEVAAAILTGC